jgi:hypothetical protein
MKIVSLTSENVKRLKAVRITPKGNMVQITGRNGQGKSSVLDSIWFCLAGSGVIQSAPIRKGQERAQIRLDLGDLVVTRTFRRSTEPGKAETTDFTTKIIVETKDGGLLRSPQAVLDGLLGTLTFDPLAFSRMKPKDQFDALRQFVPGIDFEKVDAQNRADFSRRTEANRTASEARAAASMIMVPDGTPAEGVDENALIKDLQEAGEKNAGEAQRATNRANAVTRVAEFRKSGADALAAIAAKVAAEEQQCDADMVEMDRQLRELRDRMEARRVSSADRIIKIRTAAEAENSTKLTEAHALQSRIDAAPPMEEIDTAPLMAKIEKARKTNEAVRRAEERAKHHSVATRYETEAQDLTDKIDARNKAKRDAISAAKMPVPGLDFGDGVVLLNGVPFEQASDAERLRTSVAIGMASNPKLRVIRIRDGSLLDEDAMTLLAQMADERDFQVWVERVDSSGAVGFVLEDGEVREAEQEGAAA